MRSSPQAPLSISVIIPTRGRDRCVRDVLNDLNAQSYSDFDVWIVDQNEKKLESLDKEIPNKTFHHEKMPALGSHAGRNHAISKTSSSLCLFIDDDVRIQPDFVQNHLRFWEVVGQSTNLGAVVGKVIQPKDRYSTDDMKKLGKLAEYNPWTGLVTGNFIGSKSGEIQHIHECNFSARTDLLRKIGGFNEEFRGNAYFEGADLGLRILQEGLKIFYEPSLEVIHLQDGVGGNRVQLKADHTYWYMRNYSLLNSLHMKRMSLPLYFAYGCSYVFGKSLKNRDLSLAKKGFQGLLDGMKYFSVKKERFHSSIKKKRN